MTRIEVEKQFVDYRRLADSTYRNVLSFGEALSQSFDSVARFRNYPVVLTLPHHLNHLTFHFSAIDWSAPHKVRYSYMLEGLDEGWSPPQSETVASYFNIPPGRHTFMVRAMGEARVWGEPFAYSFTIRPPWWQTNLAYVLYLLTLGGAIWLLVRWRTHEQRQKLAQERMVSARLRQIDQLKDQFLANTSHELRTPLHGIIGIAESMFDDAARKSVDDLRQNLGLIVASGRRLSSLVNDLLDFSRAKNHDIQLQLKSLPLYSFADIVLRSSQILVGNKSVQLKNEIPVDLPPVLADDNRLQQILFNLIGNAIKFTHEGYVKVTAELSPAGGGLRGGKTIGDNDSAGVSLSATPSGGGEDLTSDQIIVCVEDTGIGIPVDKHQSIFQSFEQADGSTTREYGGTGLGLSITRELVELHGGKIWLNSAPGQGSRFFFTLPVSDKPTQLLPAIKGESGSPVTLEDIKLVLPVANSATDRIKVLVVDDEPINHQVLRNHLSDDKYLITSVMSGQEAIEAIELGVMFDLVLLDVMMPRMSGYEVCEKMREKYLPSELPIIMVTAKNQVKDLVQGLSAGANDYLAKPFSKEEFLARVKTQLDLHRINEVTGRFVPNEFLRSLNRERITDVMLGDHAEREVTVLFADIRDYTTLAENMTPQENFNFINAYNGRMGPIIKANWGFINQYLGDGIMAIFLENPADALRAAIAMHREVATYNKERAAKGRLPIRIGIGLHTGPLIMGVTGDRNRMEATTIADTVNTASRIESLTKYYGVSILLSEDSLDKMGDNVSFHLRYLGRVKVKGRKEPVNLYECFDGDAPIIKDRKLETLRDFKRGLAHFFAREFPEAAAAFGQVVRLDSEDPTAKLFLNKSATYIQTGVPEDWTGVEVMTFK